MSEREALFDHVHHVTHLEVGDVIAYTGRRYDRRLREWVTPEPTDHDWLCISRFDDEGGLHGYRVNPQEWEREVEFVVVRQQIEDAGVLRRA